MGRRKTGRVNRYGRWIAAPTPRQPSDADLICAAAKDVDEALVLWHVKTVRLCRDVTRLIPQSKAAWELLKMAEKGEAFPLWNHIMVDEP